MLFQNPRVTIVMPVYNKERYLQKAFHSAITQSYDNFEILLINDGSSDGSHLLIQPFLRFENVRYVNLYRNRGTLYVRALGISMSSALVMFLDADDELSPGILQLSVSKMLESSTDIVYFNMGLRRHGSSGL